MDSDEGTFTAFLVHPGRPALDRSVELPLLEPLPPERLRIPVERQGGSRHVYELLTAEAWPREATYRFAAAEPDGSERSAAENS